VSVQSFIEGILTTGIEDSPDDLYFRALPNVTFEPGRIRFRLLLGQNLSNKPDPTITINASFGLGIEDGDFVPRGRDVDAEVTLPRWVYLQPGAAWITVVLAIARVAAHQAAMDAITSVVGAINFVFFVEDGYVRQNVNVFAEDGGGIEVTNCPSDLLLEVAKMSEVE
jgi:hypothetical protein